MRVARDKNKNAQISLSKDIHPTIRIRKSAGQQPEDNITQRKRQPNVLQHDFLLRENTHSYQGLPYKETKIQYISTSAKIRNVRQFNQFQNRSKRYFAQGWKKVKTDVQNNHKDACFISKLCAGSMQY